MGDAGKRDAINGFLETGTFAASTGDIQEGVAAPSGPLDAAWLAEIKANRARLHADPAREVARYRAFFKKPELTEAEVDQLLGTMEAAVEDPEGFHDQLAAQDDDVVEEGVGASILKGLGCAVKIPRFFPLRAVTDGQVAAIAKLRAEFGLDSAVEINPNVHQFEMCDPGWWKLLKAGVFDIRHWPEGLEPFIKDGPGRGFVYADTRASKTVALMADFGVGHYHSHFIARQLEAKRYPHVFHLGDVYYGGTDEQFANNYAGVLDGVMNHSLLWSMPENHELYGRGTAWQKFIQAELGKKRIMQDGSYFCVRFPKHQIVAIDVNWHGRQLFEDEDSRHWLREALRGGEGLTTILLTGSAPYAYGEAGTTKLYDDLREWHELGLFHMWFWGDDHYCALFERQDTSRFIGSCIGHGGYPGDRQKPGAPTFAPTTWVETEPRFPETSGLRTDLGNNGWVELTMLDDGGIELLYVDWLGAKRLQVAYALEAAANPGGGHLKLVSRQDFARVKAF